MLLQLQYLNELYYDWLELANLCAGEITLQIPHMKCLVSLRNMSDYGSKTGREHCCMSTSWNAGCMCSSYTVHKVVDLCLFRVNVLDASISVSLITTHCTAKLFSHSSVIVKPK